MSPTGDGRHDDEESSPEPLPPGVEPEVTEEIALPPLPPGDGRSAVKGTGFECVLPLKLSLYILYVRCGNLEGCRFTFCVCVL